MDERPKNATGPAAPIGINQPAYGSRGTEATRRPHRVQTEERQRDGQHRAEGALHAVAIGEEIPGEDNEDGESEGEGPGGGAHGI